MYTLTLTQGERAAFDFVDGRYAAGDIKTLLYIHCTEGYIEWFDKGDITFKIPEHIAWQIKNLAEEENYFWPCFSDCLIHKMDDFLNKIV